MVVYNFPHMNEINFCSPSDTGAIENVCLSVLAKSDVTLTGKSVGMKFLGTSILLASNFWAGN